MFRDNKREIFGFRKYKAYGLASAVIAAFFLMGGVASADEVTQPTTSDVTALTTTSPTEASADNATAASGEEVSSNNVVANTTQLSSVETSTNPTGASIQPEDAQSSSESDANTKHFEIETTDVSRATFEERLDALDDLIKTDIARALNDSMGQAVNSYNQIEGVAPITDVPMLTKDDVKLTYNRSILKPVKTGNLYMFTEKPVALAYDVTVPGFITTYQKMIPMVASVRTIVSLPVVMNKFVGESASKPIDEIGRPLDNIGTKIDSLTTTRTIAYNIEGSNDTARSSIHNSITRYTPFFSPSIISYDTKVPGDVPSVEIPQLKVTCYTLEDGTEIKDAEEGFVDAPNTIGKYQFTGTTNTNEGGDIQTHIYKPIETEVPGDAPSVDVPELKVTRYQTEDGTEIKDSEEGLVDAPNTIGNYQFTGTTNLNEGGDVQTHIYSKIVTEIPSDTPKREPEEIQITLHVDEETGKELVEYDPGLTSPKEIEHYTYTGKTTQEEGIRTHYYKKVITEIPGDAPQVDVPQLKVTRYQTEDGTEIKDSEEGFVNAPNTIGNYQFTGITNMNEGNDVQTHIYSKIVTEVPGDAPVVDVPALKVTRYQTEDGTEIKDSEQGFVDAPNTIGDYQFTGVTNMNEGNDVQTHIYSKIVTEIPRESLVLDKIEYKMTRYVDEQGQELTLFDFGLRGPKAIEDYVFTGRTDSNKAGDVLTHVYRKVVVESKVPGDAPQYDIPELKVTRHVDEKGKELIETEKGTQPPRKTIRENEYTGRTTEKDGITTHVYAPIKHEVPGDAPVADVPELKVTRYVNEKGEEIKESEAGFINAPKTIGEYEFTGKTEFNDGKDVQTHIYKLVEKPVTPTPDPKKPETPSPRTPEPKKPETPQPEAPKPIETSKSNDSKPVVVESVDQPQFVKDELPKTGETNSNLALIGVSLLTALGLIGFAKRKREN